MSYAKSVFIAIDKVFKRPQNPRRLLKQLSDVKCVRDIVYDDRYPEMALDLYFMPRSDGSAYPVIFEIHGGGFAAGDKKYRECLCRYLAKRSGAMVVNVNYGVGRENACPLPMQHLAAAVNFVAKAAKERNLDLSKFVVTGDSAGAFYACFLAVLQDSSELQEIFGCKLNARFTAAVLNCGLYDMTAYLNKRGVLFKGACVELFGVPPKQVIDGKYARGVNLISHIGEKFPPSFVIYAQKDVFCKGQAEELLKKLREKEVPVQCVQSTSLLANHTYSLVWNSKLAKETNKRIIEFLKNHFESGK